MEVGDDTDTWGHLVSRRIRGREGDAARASARCWASAFVKPRWGAGLGRDSWALQRALAYGLGGKKRERAGQRGGEQALG
jgi:hypothetical protein